MTTSNDEFWIWRAGRETQSCRLTRLEGFDEDHLLRRGEALSERWPTDVRYHMDPAAPNDMRLCDNVKSIKPVIVASARLSDFLRQQAGPAIECLPIAIVNHKRRVEAQPFFIVRPLGLVDALDRERSKPTWSKISPDSIEVVKRLVVDADRVPQDRLLFRLQHYMRVILVRRRLAQAIDEAGFTNIQWQALRDHESL